jgi:hypothetical protein
LVVVDDESDDESDDEDDSEDELLEGAPALVEDLSLRA